MSSPGKTPKHIKLDERTHVEKPLLDQLAGLGWEVIDLTDVKQTPADTVLSEYRAAANLESPHVRL